MFMEKEKKKKKKKGQKVRCQQTNMVFIIRSLTRTVLSLWCYTRFCASLKLPKSKIKERNDSDELICH